MLSKRIIPCLDVKDGRTVKGVNFVDLKDAGDPVELAWQYAQQGADELVFLDITATHEKRGTTIEMVKAVARQLNIPFTIGGGISSVADAEALLNSGADKISINSAAVRRPALIQELAEAFGVQFVVVAVDTKLTGQGNLVHLNGGRLATELDTLSWIKEAESLGAGEILLTSMDHDGTKQGFDCRLLDQVCSSINIPVIASGGAGKTAHFTEVFTQTAVDAALAASMKIDFDKSNGLVPVVVQDVQTLEVLMLGYMNAEAWSKTQAEGVVTFFSRTKNRLWTKGESSGNYLKVQEVHLDCDNDTLLIKVVPTGPTCHTGSRSCFKTSFNQNFLFELENIIADRYANPAEESYVNKLRKKGLNKIAQKVGEEGVETVIAALNETDVDFVNEKITQMIKLQHTLSGHQNPVYALSLAPDPTRFYSAGNDKGIVEWSLDEMAFVKVLVPVQSSVYALHRYKHLLFIAQRSGLIQVFDLQQQKILATLKHHQKAVFDLKTIAYKNELLSTGEDGSLAIWSLDDFSLLYHFQVLNNTIRVIAVSPDEKEIALGAKDGMLRLYNSEDYSLLKEIPAHNFPVTSIQYEPSGKYMISGSRDAQLKDKSIKLWDSSSFKLYKILSIEKGTEGHFHSINKMIWTQDGKHLISTGDDRSIKIWTWS
eukprot:gene9003-11023_t